MNEPPIRPGLELVLELVRGAAQDQPCPSCHRSLVGCQLSLGEADLDHVRAEVTCPACDATFTLEVSPSTDGGVATVG
ncbi:MAG: hypothetical protein ACRENV_09055 [Candidatus Dormibacteria bacterium]